MTPISRRASLSLALSAALSLAAPSSWAQANYPTRPITLLVPAPPAGYYDRVARILAAQLSKQMKVTFIVDNQAGANGAIGTSTVRRAAPDGYTLVLGAIGPFGIAPAIEPKMQYDPVKDFAPVALVTTMPVVLLVSSTSPYKTFQDLVRISKTKKEPVLYASFGIGTSSHLSMERLRLTSGANLSHVPYKGSPPAILAVVNGEVEATVSNIQDALPHIKGGKLRALAVGSKSRIAALPDTPTFAESGLPQLEVSNWIGVLAPAQTPASVVQRLNAEINTALNDPEVRQKAAPAQELVFLGGTPADFQKHIAAEIARWKQVVAAANIKKED